MPESCAAWGCTNRRSIGTKSRGITFHKFPRAGALRRQWERAVRKEGFSASNSSVICSEHFSLSDFDSTGQTIRIRDGAKPSLFKSPRTEAVTTRTTRASRKAAENLPLQRVVDIQEPEPSPNADHSYALPASPEDLKARLAEALARMDRLEREMRNAKNREWRAKINMRGLLENLREKNHFTCKQHAHPPCTQSDHR